MKRIRLILFIPLILFLFIACKQKKKEKEKFFSALSFIKSQVAHVDTSFYPIKKIVFRDSVTTDTLYYKREEFNELARDFLTLPDISDESLSKHFTEESRLDESINRVILTYLPINPDKELIRRQEILIEPGDYSDKVTNIIIDYFSSNKDSSIEKKLLWRTDKSFQVATTKQLPGRPDTTTMFKVTWNEDESE